MAALLATTDAVAVAADSVVVDADGGAAEVEAEAALARFCWVVHLATVNYTINIYP